ncbi:MAG: hypothetical protein JW738_07875 [Actinobacteria bacterium]|nr:hypothetical protein [Actinomycetota bacterium]
MELTGRILKVPYDFRFPTISRFKQRMWNKEDPHIVTPRAFGIGWDINLAALKEKNRLAYYAALIYYLNALLQLVFSVRKGLKKIRKS